MYSPDSLRGKVVKVVKGRNVPKGTTGECFWVGRDKFAARHGAVKYRIGLKDAAGTVHWTAATNVEVVEGTGPALEARPGRLVRVWDEDEWAWRDPRPGEVEVE